MQEELPDGCFWLLSRPADPAQIERLRVRGPLSWCRFLLKDGAGSEQSRYQLLRALFPMTYREFKQLEKQAVDAEKSETDH
jgi:hypothetical protein